jgi:hypothetical protein
MEKQLSKNSDYKKIRFNRLPPPFPVTVGIGRRKSAVAIVTIFLKGPITG